MPLQRRKTSKWWYGRWEANGKTYCKNLDVEVKGTPPSKRGQLGDTIFEKSKTRAQSKLDELIAESNRKAHAEELVQSLHEIRTGERVTSIPLEDMPDAWERIPRSRKLNDRYQASMRSALEGFVEFVQEHHPRAKEMAHITRAIARDYLEHERKTGITNKTWNDRLKLLRSTFKHLRREAGLPENPFDEIPLKQTETVSRAPFTIDELKDILNACKDDDLIRPIIVTGACTAMRRADCCRLRWSDVDLDEGFLTVKTSKTGETVDIPIFPMLRDELLRAQDEASPSDEFCFPEQEAIFSRNPDEITARVKAVITRAFTEEAENPEALPMLSEQETRKRGEDYIASVTNPKKSARMAKVFAAYMSGKQINDVMKEAGVSKGSVSGYLNEIEDAIKCRVIRGKTEPRATPEISAPLAVKRKGLGKRNASVRDFHSFRVTWITLALASGVPLELVQRVTGHRTTEVVLKHYFRPGREDFRKAISSAMPKLLMKGKHVGPKEQMLQIIDDMTADSLDDDRKKLAELVHAI